MLYRTDGRWKIYKADLPGCLCDASCTSAPKEVVHANFRRSFECFMGKGHIRKPLKIYEADL